MALSNNTKDADAIKTVQALIKRVCRGFYTAKHAIVVDIILKHSIMRDDHISLLMALQNLEVRKLCGKLREDRILTMYDTRDLLAAQHADFCAGTTSSKSSQAKRGRSIERITTWSIGMPSMPSSTRCTSSSARSRNSRRM